MVSNIQKLELQTKKERKLCLIPGCENVYSVLSWALRYAGL